MKKPLTKPTSDSEEDELSDYEGIQADSDDDILKQINEESDDESSEEEVLPIHSGESDSDEGSEEEGDISDSDLDAANDDLPDSKAWGKKAKYFYNSNTINEKRNFVNDEEEELAKMEEMEARTIQQRLMSELDDADLSLDLLSDVIAAQKEEKQENDAEIHKVGVDFSQLNESEKLNLLKNESPELFTYIEDYKSKPTVKKLMTCVRDELLPTLAKLKKKKLKDSMHTEFITIYYQFIMNYCVNVTFYMMLKAKKVDTRSHPVAKWLEKMQKTLAETSSMYQKVIKAQVSSLLSGDAEKKVSKKRKLTAPTSVVKQKKKRLNNADEGTSKDTDKSAGQAENNLYLESEEEENDESKRPITYQIAKNKGLTPRRKKEVKNPRVKYRNKYRKAKIRRKGQIREVRKETQKYAGEISGIKAGVVKSVKFKV